MLDNYRDLIDELLGTPSEVKRLVQATGGDPPADARTLIAELRDRDRAVTDRLQTIMREPVAHLPVIEASVGDRAEGLDDTDLLDGMDRARGDLVSLLMNLTLRDWERTATHDIDGEVTLAEEVERHVEFDEAHLKRIAAATRGGSA